MYVKKLSEHRPKEAKIVGIDNAEFHSTINMTILANIFLIRIPPYSPELNPWEQVWDWMKSKFKNRIFDDMHKLKKWLHKIVANMPSATIKYIVSNHHYLKAFN